MDKVPGKRPFLRKKGSPTFHTSQFSQDCDQISDTKQLKDGRVYFVSKSEIVQSITVSTAWCRECDMTDHIVSSVKDLINKNT